MLTIAGLEWLEGIAINNRDYSHLSRHHLLEGNTYITHLWSSCVQTKVKLVISHMDVVVTAIAWKNGRLAIETLVSFLCVLIQLTEQFVAEVQFERFSRSHAANQTFVQHISTKCNILCPLLVWFYCSQREVRMT